MKQRADGRWQKSKTINGKRVWFISSEPTEQKANKDIERQMLNYHEKEEKGPLFVDVAEKCESEVSMTLPEMTYRKTYVARYRHVREYFSDEYIKNITPKDIERYFAYLKKLDYSEKSIAMHKTVLNTIFNYAFINGDIQSNFILQIKNPAKGKKQKRRMPEKEDIEIIKNNHDGIGYMPFFILYTGLRPSEAFAITNKDFDFANDNIIVNKRVIHYGNKPVVEYETKTDAGERYVSLLKKIKDTLPKFEGFLFSADGGKTPLTKKQIQYRYDKWRNETGCTCTLYQIRHAYATLLHEAGVSEFDAMKLMGHSSIQVTKDIYTEIRKKQIDKATAMLNNYDY